MSSVSSCKQNKMVFNLKVVLVAVAVAMFCVSFSEVTGMPSINEQNATAIERPKRESCSAEWGCHDGYCWADCQGYGYTGWCWTTKSYSQSYQWVTCEHSGQCGQCDSCADPCSPSSNPWHRD